MDPEILGFDKRSCKASHRSLSRHGSTALVEKQNEMIIGIVHTFKYSFELGSQSGDKLTFSSTWAIRHGTCSIGRKSREAVGAVFMNKGSGMRKQIHDKSLSFGAHFLDMMYPVGGEL